MTYRTHRYKDWKVPVPHDFKRVENEPRNVKITQELIQSSAGGSSKGFDKTALVQPDFYYSLCLSNLRYFNNDLISFDSQLL